ncbi:hypothetical protein [Variovorax sp. DAIF25]
MSAALGRPEQARTAVRSTKVFRMTIGYIELTLATTSARISP